MSAAANDKTYAVFPTSANKKLVSELLQKAAKVFLFPPLEVEKKVLDKTQIELLRSIKSFDWIIFTDILATNFFLESLADNKIDFFEMDAVRVCAFGEAVSDRLRFAQLHADVVPALIDTGSIIKVIADYVHDKRLKNLKFLVVKEVSQHFTFKETLEESSAVVSELSLYAAKINDNSEAIKLKTLLKSGAIDEFVFSHPQDFFSLGFYFAGESLSAVLSEIKISATGENAFQTAKEFDLRPHYFRLQK